MFVIAWHLFSPLLEVIKHEDSESIGRPRTITEPFYSAKLLFTHIDGKNVPHWYYIIISGT